MRGRFEDLLEGSFGRLNEVEARGCSDVATQRAEQGPRASEGAGCSVRTAAQDDAAYNVDATTIGRLLGDRPYHGGANVVALQ
jgi:hypothetical protein